MRCNTRAANLANLAGLFEEEATILQNARTVLDDSVFAHQVAENFLRLGRIKDAEGIFASLDLDVDIYANLGSRSSI